MPRILMPPLLRLLLLSMTVLLVGPMAACETLAPLSRSADVGRRPPTFGEPYPYTDGINVQVTEVWSRHQLGVPLLELTVVVTNGSDHTFEVWMRGELRHGAYRLPALRYTTPPGPDDSGGVQLIAVGEDSDPYRLRYILPPGSRTDLQFELAIDPAAHDPAVFVGSLP